MGTLLGAPMGRALLAAIALGLLGYALWRLVEGALDPERRGSDVKALAVRTSFIVRGLAHGLLALSAAKLALGKPSSGNDEKGEQATRAAFELPAGEWIVWAAAIGIAGYGVYQLYRAATAKLSDQLDTAGDVQRGRPLGDRREPVRHRRARRRLHRHRVARYARSIASTIRAKPAECEMRSARFRISASGRSPRSRWG